MALKDVLAAFPVICYGVTGDGKSPLLHPVTASVEIGKKGQRKVGCCYLSPNWKIGGPEKGECLAADWGRRTCPHLIPVTQDGVSDSKNMAEPDAEQNIPF